MKLRHWLIIPVLLAAYPALEAQQPAQKLTLASALDIAQRQNLDLAAARAQRAVALAGVHIAGERPNPTLNFSASRDLPHESVFVDQPLELWPKRERRIEVARRESALTETDIAAVERQVRHSVRDAYFGMAFARAVTAQRANALRLAGRLRGIAQARFEAGDIPQIEVTQAELESTRAETSFQVAQQEEKVALSQLNALLNEPVATDWELGDAFTVLPTSLSLDDLLARTASSNATIAQVSQQKKVQQSETSLLRAQRMPNLGLQFGADLNARSQGAPGGYDAGARGGFSLELPVFSHKQGEIEQSLASEHAFDSALTAAQHAAAAKVQAAYFDLEARRMEAQLYRDRLLPASRQLEETAEESYRAGKANILTVLGAQRDVQQVESDYLSSLLGLQSAFSQMEEAVGAPLD